MKTSCFHYRGPGRIAICRWVPRGTPAGYRMYKPLAPHGLQDLERPEFIERYQTMLDALNPRATWDELHALAGGVEPVLLCWETPEQIAKKVAKKDWCHRHLVAEWFRSKLGVAVSEI